MNQYQLRLQMFHQIVYASKFYILTKINSGTNGTNGNGTATTSRTTKNIWDVMY